MGKFEKLVVLTVVFAAAIVLAVSFLGGKGEVEASDPMTGARQVLDEELDPDAGLRQSLGGLAGRESPSSNDGRPAPSLLLNAGEPWAEERGGESAASGLSASEGEFTAGLRSATGAGRGTLTADPAVDADQRILKDGNGLRPSFLDEYRMYTVGPGDTWSGLAQRFYQDGRYTRNLHIANEDLDELAPGKDILVPVFDLLAEELSREVAAPARTIAEAQLASGKPTSASPAKPVTRTPATGPAAPAGQALEYQVRPGDTLSEISMAVFGTSTRWKEILEANKDKLQRPESLRSGMKLKIPAGGKLPTGSASEASEKRADPKVKPSQTAEAAAPKKKKVL